MVILVSSSSVSVNWFVNPYVIASLSLQQLAHRRAVEGKCSGAALSESLIFTRNIANTVITEVGVADTTSIYQIWSS